MVLGQKRSETKLPCVPWKWEFMWTIRYLSEAHSSIRCEKREKGSGRSHKKWCRSMMTMRDWQRDAGRAVGARSLNCWLEDRWELGGEGGLGRDEMRCRNKKKDHSDVTNARVTTWREGASLLALMRNQESWILIAEFLREGKLERENSYPAVRVLIISSCLHTIVRVRIVFTRIDHTGELRRARHDFGTYNEPMSGE